MPNSRRRRFSVHNGIGCKESGKIQSSVQSSNLDVTSEKSPTNIVPKTKSKIKDQPNSSKIKISPSKVNCESKSRINCGSNSSTVTANMTVDKDVTASSSNIDLFNIICDSKELPSPSAQGINEKCDTAKRSKPTNGENTVCRRDKYPRQHRIKVRSPKRRIVIPDIQARNNDVYKRTVGTLPIDWDQEVEVCVDNVANIETTEEDERQSDHSLDDMCRICHGGDSLTQELGPLISACSCRGTVGRVHVKCLERWLTESGKSRCELCGTRYATRRVHRYGVPKALVMWVLSQNAKQLMVDSLGIMLMSPLAVLAAWLSGRTLAGLMTQDNHATPWPLASTFVLACMTLVCYYCWIVSAATRHALGWWIWYRSQYEVRLTLQDYDN